MDVTKILRQVSTGYYHASLDRAVGFRPPGSDVETVTQSLPLKYVAIVDLGQRVRVTLIVDLSRDEGPIESWRVGVSSVEIMANEDELLTSALYRRIPLHALLVDAIRRWSHNSDGSEVTVEQASALTRPVAQRGTNTPEERWRRAARAYLEAKKKDEPTTVAVAQAMGLSTSKAGQDAARSLVRRARQAGHLPPARKGN